MVILPFAVSIHNLIRICLQLQSTFSSKFQENPSHIKEHRQLYLSPPRGPQRPLRMGTLVLRAHFVVQEVGMGFVADCVMGEL
jgi:hypothetical protein